MLLKHLQSEILQKLSQHSPGAGADLKFYSVAGGSINETYRLELNGRQFLCKINSASLHPGFF
jgi:fructosamine-3-kinase